MKIGMKPRITILRQKVWFYNTGILHIWEKMFSSNEVNMKIVLLIHFFTLYFNICIYLLQGS